ncbi:MAG: nicotinamide-nucleotide adenylyltransferase [Candidatus Micrarchaeota archaeon]
MIGLFIGRFQPFHNGHLKAIGWILERCDQVIILIGSSQSCYELDNPFTVGERVEMITRTLRGRGLSENCIVLSVPDVNNNALWVAHINSLVPRYDVVFTNNSLAKKLLVESGKDVSGIPFFKRKEYDATGIRKSMLRDNSWKRKVPEEVVAFIGEIGGIRRIKDIMKGDKHGATP